MYCNTESKNQEYLNGLNAFISLWKGMSWESRDKQIILNNAIECMLWELTEQPIYMKGCHAVASFLKLK